MRNNNDFIENSQPTYIQIHDLTIIINSFISHNILRPFSKHSQQAKRETLDFTGFVAWCQMYLWEGKTII